MKKPFRIFSNEAEISISDFFDSSSARVKNVGATKGLVLVGIVTRGKISEGDSFRLELGTNHIYDAVVSLEKNHNKIKEAAEGESIGICLRKYTAKEIEALLS